MSLFLYWDDDKLSDLRTGTKLDNTKQTTIKQMKPKKKKYGGTKTKS